MSKNYKKKPKLAKIVGQWQHLPITAGLPENLNCSQIKMDSSVSFQKD